MRIGIMEPKKTDLRNGRRKLSLRPLYRPL